LVRANICFGPGGPDAEATAILGALLDLADQLPDTKAFRQRLGARNTDRRDLVGWVWAGLEMENNEACAKVAEDLRLFNLPYTADILAARSYGDARGGWAAAVSAARSPRYSGGGADPVADGTLGWRTGLGGGVRGWRIGCDGGWTAFVGPTLASPRGRIGAVMSPSDWAMCVWIPWPLLMVVVGLDYSLLVFRTVWRDLSFALRVTCIGRLRLEAERRAPAGRLLPHNSAGWDRIAATQRRRLVCPLVSIPLRGSIDPLRIN